MGTADPALADDPEDSEADADAGVLFTATDGSIKLAFLAGHIPRRCASNVRIPLALAWRHELGVRQMATKSPILLYVVQALLRRQLALWVPPIVVVQSYSQSTWTTILPSGSARQCISSPAFASLSLSVSVDLFYPCSFRMCAVSARHWSRPLPASGWQRPL